MPAGELEIAGPRAINGFAPGLEIKAVVKVSTPPLETYELEEAEIIGGTDFIAANGAVAYPSLYVPERDVCPAELHGAAKLDVANRRIKIFTTHKPLSLSQPTVSLVGQCTHNYAHWITETLPKLMVLETHGECSGAPLLVDAGLHHNIKESLHFFVGDKRPVLTVKRWQPAKCAKLIAISSPGYTPFQTRGGLSGLGASVFDCNSFSPWALNAMRQRADEILENQPLSSQPRRLYLRRLSGRRRVLNQTEVEAMVEEFGFTIVSPETLSFADQVSLFRNAEMVIAPVGAALANLVFTRPGCKVTVFARKMTDPNYYYFDTLAKVMGHDFRYILGEAEDEKGVHFMHQNFSTDLGALRTALVALTQRGDWGDDGTDASAIAPPAPKGTQE